MGKNDQMTGQIRAVYNHARRNVKINGETHPVERWESMPKMIRASH